MRPPRRTRTGARRDGQVRVIRSNMSDTHVTVHGLGTVRDTGLALEGRMARQRRQRERKQRAAIAWTLVVVVALGVGAYAWWGDSERRAAASPFSDLPNTANNASPAHQTPGTIITASRPVLRDPTPIFARYRSLQLRLPVSVQDLTEVGFHQAAYPYAMHMSTPLTEADNSDTKDAHGTGRDPSKQPTGADAVLEGKFIRMWRARPGEPDTASDIGGPPGADVYAPVSGTIIKIKEYKLYRKWDDYEIHIQPKGWPDLDLVMIHVSDLSAEVGDEVVGGVTRIAAIRKLSTKVHHQLREYTGDGGDHAHIQVNNAKDPRYKGLEGAITVSPAPQSQ